MNSPEIISDEFIRKNFKSHVIASKMVAESKEDGDISPMFVTVDEEGRTEATLLADFPNDYNAKRKLLHELGVKHGSQNRSVALIMFTSMAWVVRQSMDTPLEEVMKIKPSESPDRQEVLVCSAAAHDKRSMFWSCPTTRNGDLSQPIRLSHDEAVEMETMEPKGCEGISIDLLDCYWLGYANS